MIKVFATLIIILFTIALNAQEYKVEVKNTLNIRSEPNNNAAIIGKVKNNQVVYVFDIQNGWARIKYNNKDAYVSSQYLKLHKKSDTSSNSSNERYERDRTFSTPSYVIYLIIILLFCTKMAAKRTFNSTNALILLTILCSLELIYYFGFSYLFNEFDHQGPLWFGHPRSVGFFLGIVTSFLFYLFIYFQAALFLEYIEERFNGDESLSTAVYVTGGAAFLLGLEFVPFAPVAGIIVGLISIPMQLCQVYRIIFKLSYNVTAGLANVFTYLISLAATALLFRYAPGRIMYVIDYIAY